MVTTGKKVISHVKVSQKYRIKFFVYSLAFEKKIVLEYSLCVRALDFLENRALHEKIVFYIFDFYMQRNHFLPGCTTISETSCISYIFLWLYILSNNIVTIIPIVLLLLLLLDYK